MTTHDGVEQCPTGCGFDELEIDTLFNHSDGLPLVSIKCGKCGYAPNMTAFDRPDAIECWNEAISDASEKGDTK